MEFTGHKMENPNILVNDKTNSRFVFSMTENTLVTIFTSCVPSSHSHTHIATHSHSLTPSHSAPLTLSLSPLPRPRRHHHHRGVCWVPGVHGGAGCDPREGSTHPRRHTGPGRHGDGLGRHLTQHHRQPHGGESVVFVLC